MQTYLSYNLKLSLMEKKMANVLVLGGGFAGVEASIYLRKNGHRVTW